MNYGRKVKFGCVGFAMLGLLGEFSFGETPFGRFVLTPNLSFEIMTDFEKSSSGIDLELATLGACFVNNRCYGSLIPDVAVFWMLGLFIEAPHLSRKNLWWL